MQQINIPGVGPVNFPQSMSDAEIKEAIQTKILPKHGMSAPQSMESVPRGTNADVLSQIGRYGKDSANTFMQSVLGAGDAVNNLPRAIANMLAPKSMQAPMVQTGNPENIGYKTGRLGGDIAAFMGGGEVAEGARAASETIPYLEKLAGMLKTPAGQAAGRIGGTSFVGAAENPENRGAGATLGALAGVGGEVLPAAASGIGKLAEMANPVEYTKQLARTISEQYKKATAEASSLYSPVLKKHAEAFINPIEELSVQGKDVHGLMPTTAQKIEKPSSSLYETVSKPLIKKHYDVDLKDLHDDFIKNPTFNNAHDLQSQLGIEVRSLQSSKSAQEPVTKKEAKALNRARNAILSDMGRYLENVDPEMKQMYSRGASLFKNNVAPYRANEVISKIAEGKKQTISPAVLKNRLVSMKEGGSFDVNHYLSQALNGLTKKVDTGKAIGHAGSLIGALGGAGLGTAIHPGVGSGLGFIGGAMAGKPIMKLAENPQVQNIFSKSKGGYDALRQAIIATLLSRQGQQP